MKNKFFYLIGGAIVMLCVGYFFTPSYSLSSKAKKEFAKGNYQESLHLATLALEKNPYNRAAFSLVNQSRQRLNFQKFLQKTQASYEKILKLLQNPSITPQEFLEIQWLYEIFSQEYSNLYFFKNKTKTEKEEVENYAQWFKQLKEKIDLAKSQINH